MNTVEPSSAQASGSRRQSAADNASAAESPSLESLVARVADEFLQRQRDGEEPDVEEYAARHPEAAGVLREVLAALCLVRLSSAAGGSSAGAEDPLGGCLGDFRIVREMGRGGMGVVYEAEQISLRRRVALKMLPFAGALDAKLLQRFRNEALAAASLHHEHIILVHAVGCERGIHFYAMQFVEGCTLAQLIKALRREDDEPPSDPAHTTDYRPGGDSPTPLLAALSTERAEPRGRPYYRHAAELMTDAAQALDYAHQMGVVHRDVKPGNLMVDTRGTLWVTDFGLAHLQQGEASLTMTGDLVGTLRYMSPEQALAKRVPIDHRCDVYSLGVTLYELLTLRPAFTGNDRQELLRQIAFEEPPAPRKIERNIPAELETIALKAMEKNPADRYGTALELANDLRRFLADRPIKARRPTLQQVALKWARRHTPLVAAVAAVLVVVILLVGGTRLWWAQKRASAVGEARAALAEATRLSQEDKWPEALNAVRHTKEFLVGVAPDTVLWQKIEEMSKDVEMVLRLEEARVRMMEIKDWGFDLQAGDAAFVEAFQWYGLDVEGPDAREAAEQIRSRAIWVQLVAALDEWALVRRRQKVANWNHLVTIARAADPDPWRDRLRDAMEKKDLDLLAKLVASTSEEDLSRATVLLLVGHTVHTGLAEQALNRLMQIQRRHPGDFLVTFSLGEGLGELEQPRLEQRIRYLTAAVALRPMNLTARLRLGEALSSKGHLADGMAEFHECIRLNIDYAPAHYSMGVFMRQQGKVDEAIKYCGRAISINPDYAAAYNLLGNCLHDKGKTDEALRCYRQAIKNDPRHPQAHNNLGNALKEKGKLDEAISSYQKALEIDPRNVFALTNLGNTLTDRGKVDDAIALHRQAIKIDPRQASVHKNLGNSLRAKGKLDQAIECYRRAIEIDPRLALAHHDLAIALHAKGKLDEAIAEYKVAIRLRKDFPHAHVNLGNALSEKGKLDQAIVEYREAIHLNKDFAEAHYMLGVALSDQGKRNEAIAEYKEAIRLKKDFVEAHYNLGIALSEKGELNEAIAEYQEAIRLKKDYADVYCSLGEALADKGKLADAEAAFRKSIALKPADALVRNNLGNCLFEQGKLEDAISSYEKAVRLKTDYALAHYNLGLAFVQKGQFKKGLVSLRLGHQLGSRDPNWRQPSAMWIRRAERMAQFDDRLPAVLDGKDNPKDADERLGFASLCKEHHKRFVAAARFFDEAFVQQPALAANLQAAHRYNAACAAALAGCGQGEDAAGLAEMDRAGMRKQALDWLRADLDAWRGLLKKEPEKVRPVIIKQMQRWQADTDFGGVRGPQAIGKLPEAERAAWQKLWADVANTLARAERKAASEKKPTTK